MLEARKINTSGNEMENIPHFVITVGYIRLHV
jgi:uncharacterized membrane protein YecN with MAPEG domain